MQRIQNRQIALPRFQRYETWSHSNVAQLFNTILQDLPCGITLVLEVGNEERFVSRPISGAPDVGERITEHLLDGQQRVTAIWRGLKNNYQDRTYFLNFSVDEETGMEHFVDSISRSKRDGDTELRPFWANKPIEQWRRRRIPLDLFAPDFESQQRYDAWSQEAIENMEERLQVNAKVYAVRSTIANFNLPILSLPVETEPDTALDVFVKMNTSETPLSAFDIVVAQVEANAEKSLHDLVAETREVCSEITYYCKPEDLVLQAGALLQGRVPTRNTYLSKEFGARLVDDDNLEKLHKGIRRATEFLNDEGIFDSDRLPTDVIVPNLVALWAKAPEGGDEEGHARSILRKYLWRALFSNRYERGTNTASLVDHNELVGLFQDSSSEDPIIFDDEQYPLPEIGELIQAGWPKKKDRLPRTILCMSLRHGGLDLMDATKANRNNLAQREYHHLFPSAYLKREHSGIADSKIFSALNCALVTWRTNRSISDKEPERYLTERRMDNDPNDSEIKHRLESHFIPYEEMMAGDYEAFLQKRAELIHDAMSELCI